MKPLKILLPVHVFFPDHFYGTETYTLELAKNLQSLGHFPIILTATPYGEKGAGTLYSQYEYDGLPVHVIDLNLKPHNRFKQTYYRPELKPLFAEIISNINPDIVHVTHLINHTGILLEVLRDQKIPAVATLTDFYGFCFNNKLQKADGSLCRGPNRKSTNCIACYLSCAPQLPFQDAIKLLAGHKYALSLVARALNILIKIPGMRKGRTAGHVLDVTRRIDTLRYLYAAYQIMIAPTDFLFEAYSENGFYPDRLRKINFGINLDMLKGYLNAVRTGGSIIRFGYIGQILEHKGVDLLVRAFKTLDGHYKEKKSLILYGPQDQDPEYTAYLKQLASDDAKIIFANTFPREELPKRLSEIDVLVIPSRWYENSPLVLLYALATRTPVIVTDVKGMNEFVKSGFNGYTFEKNNAAHLAAIMQKFLDAPGLMARLSENAQYTKDSSDHAQAVLSIYKEVLANKKEKGPPLK